MKASALFGSAWEDDALEILWRDAGRAFCKLRRDSGRGDAYAFVPIPSSAEHPALESVRRLTHEHDLQAYLNADWAVRPLDLARERGQTMAAGRLHGWRTARSPRSPAHGDGRFLRLAVVLCSAVGRLHGCGLIHKGPQTRARVRRH